jgi:hypothetical protein
MAVHQLKLDTIKEVGLNVNIEKTKDMLMYHHQNAGQDHNIKIDNISFQNLAQFTYLGTTVTTILCRRRLRD